MIDFKSTLKMSLISLKVNKMRSILTSLGIIIGVSAVIVMLAIGTGASKKVESDMASMGSNLLTIRSASARSGGVHQGTGTKPSLTLKDAISISKNVDGVQAVSSTVSETKQLMYGNQNRSSTVYGVAPEYSSIKNYEVEFGRWLTHDDDRNSAKVAVLGSTVASELFGDLNPVGHILRIGNVPFKVIGITKEKGSMGPMDQDDIVFIPITTAQRKVFGTSFPGTVSMILVQGSDTADLSQVEKDIDELLTLRHKISKNRTADFEIRNSAEFQEKMQSTVQTFAILLASIASVSLLVGGIGIMNIMLVSVTERTKEIGIRMAIGAHGRDILLQFLIEALILSLSGGIIGIITGISAAKTAELLVQDLTVKISLFSIILSFSFSGIIGICFGSYPAWKASKLNPIDALRYE